MSGLAARLRAVDFRWGIAAGLGVALSVAAAFAPLQAALLALSLAAAAVLVHRLGAILGTWCLFIATIPLRVPLSVDVAGTTSLFLNDLLLLALTVICVWEHGIRDVSRSLVFRIGVTLAAMAIGGLYTATRLFWGIAFAVHECGQLMAFYVAWHVVRSPRYARYTLIAFVLGMLPAVAVGLRQSHMPVREFQTSQGFVPAIAWDEAGNAHTRIFSTFEHPLHFSHALSMGVGLCLGLLGGSSAPVRLLLLGAAASMAFCNQYTYSIGGIIGTAGGALAALLMSRRRWLVGFLPFILVAYVLIAPEAFLLRIENTISGKNPTSVARLITYRQTLNVLRDHPVLGVGWGNIRTALEGEYRLTGEGTVAFTAENYFLERALATGLVGLSLSVALCLLFFRNALARGSKDENPWPRTALVAGGVAFYVQAQVIPAADVPSQYLLWTMFALAERRVVAQRERTMVERDAHVTRHASS